MSTNQGKTAAREGVTTRSDQAGSSAPVARKPRRKVRCARERILDAAQALFSAEGIQATTMRRITQLARVNLAAVNYYFCTKDDLARAVLARDIDALNGKRLQILDEVEEAAGDGPPDLEAVLGALFIPEFRLYEEDRPFVRLCGRLRYEPDEKFHRFLVSRFEEVIRRFDVALTRALPDVPRKEILWRTHFLFGALIHTWLCPSDIEQISVGLCSLSETKEVLEQFLAFGTAGFRAPAPARQEGASIEITGDRT